VIADGAAADQDVFHAHLHVFPRFPGDDFSFRAAAWEREPPTRAELDRIAAALRDRR
jgi:histidine triad (HIT) family protein